MAGRSKPKRRRQAGQVDANPVLLALRRAARLPAAEVERVQQEIGRAYEAMRQGAGTVDHWNVLAGSVELALAIESMGVVKGLQDELKATEQALADIRRRWQDRHAPVLRGHELEALRLFTTWMHRRQLEALSDAEFRQAHDLARARVLSAGGAEIDRSNLVL